MIITRLVDLVFSWQMRRQVLGAPNAVSPTCSRVHFSLFTLMQHLPELYRFIELKSFSLSHALHLIHRKMVNFQNKNTEKDIYAVQELKLIYIYVNTSMYPMFPPPDTFRTVPRNPSPSFTDLQLHRRIELLQHQLHIQPQPELLGNTACMSGKKSS